MSEEWKVRRWKREVGSWKLEIRITKYEVGSLQLQISVFCLLLTENGKIASSLRSEAVPIAIGSGAKQRMSTGLFSIINNQ